VQPRRRRTTAPRSTGRESITVVSVEGQPGFGQFTRGRPFPRRDGPRYRRARACTHDRTATDGAGVRAFRPCAASLATERSPLGSVDRSRPARDCALDLRSNKRRSRGRRRATLSGGRSPRVRRRTRTEGAEAARAQRGSPTMDQRSRAPPQDRFDRVQLRRRSSQRGRQRSGLFAVARRRRGWRSRRVIVETGTIAGTAGAARRVRRPGYALAVMFDPGMPTRAIGRERRRILEVNAIAARVPARIGLGCCISCAPMRWEAMPARTESRSGQH